jgi:hypothetical protein
MSIAERLPGLLLAGLFGLLVTLGVVASRPWPFYVGATLVLVFSCAAQAWNVSRRGADEVNLRR